MQQLTHIHTHPHCKHTPVFLSLVNRCRRKLTPTLAEGAVGSTSSLTDRGLQRRGCSYKHYCFTAVQLVCADVSLRAATSCKLGQRHATCTHSASLRSIVKLTGYMVFIILLSCDVGVCVCVCRFQSEGMCTDLRKFINGPSTYLSLPEELKSAMEAITYIAEALQAEKDYEAVRPLISKTFL